MGRFVEYSLRERADGQVRAFAVTLGQRAEQVVAGLEKGNKGYLRRTELKPGTITYETGYHEGLVSINFSEGSSLARVTITPDGSGRRLIYTDPDSHQVLESQDAQVLSIIDPIVRFVFIQNYNGQLVCQRWIQYEDPKDVILERRPILPPGKKPDDKMN